MSNSRGAPIGNQNARKRNPAYNRTIRMTDYDWNLLKDQAAKAEITVAELIRRRCLNG